MRFLAAALCLFCAGCLNMAESRKAAPTLDAAESLLMEAALRAEAALTGLARIEADPARGAEVPRIVPPALLRRVDLEWTGPVQEVVARLAEEAEFGFEMAGAGPARPVMVEVNAKLRPLIMLLRDVGLQAGSEAALTVDAGRSLVILDWTGGRK